MTPHDHTTRVPGCYRCELGLDEAMDAANEETCPTCGGEGAIGTGYSISFVDASDAMPCPRCEGAGVVPKKPIQEAPNA